MRYAHSYCHKCFECINLHCSYTVTAKYNIVYIHISQIAQIDNGAVTTQWESASSVPNSLIKEYEKSISGDVIESHTSGGQTIHTISTSSDEHNDDSPQSKKVRKDGNDDTDSR